MRSRVVNESSLAEAATRLELASAMRIGKGVKKEHGLERPSLLADAFEALVAAIYLENGYDAAKTFVHATLPDAVADAALRPGDVDPKTRLRQWSEANGLGTPAYEVTSSGPSHDASTRRSCASPDATWVRARAVEEERRGERRRRRLGATRCLSCPRSRPCAPRWRAT